MSAAVLLRALASLVVLRSMPLVSDAHDYFECAVRFAAGDTGGAFYWPPGESFAIAPLVATLGPSVTAARILTIGMSVATVAVSALLTLEVGGRRAARAAAWIAALYPPAALLCGQTYAQHLAALCLALLAYFGLRAVREGKLWQFASAGAALGIGCLTRPSMLSVVPVLAVGLWLAARRHDVRLRHLVAGGVLGSCVALAFLGPVLAHDAHAGAGWTLSTNNERNLFLGNNPYTPDYKTSQLGQRSLDELDPETRGYLESFYERADARSAMRDEAIAYVRAHPLRSALRTFNRTISFWGFDYLATREIQKWYGIGTVRALPLLALEAGGYVALAVLAMVGVLGMRGLGSGSSGERESGERGWVWWLLGLVAAYEVPYAVAFSGGAYHFPVVPLLVPFAAAALSRLVEEGVDGVRSLLATKGARVALAVFAAVQVQYAWYAVAFAQ